MVHQCEISAIVVLNSVSFHCFIERHDESCLETNPCKALYSDTPLIRQCAHIENNLESDLIAKLKVF